MSIFNYLILIYLLILEKKEENLANIKANKLSQKSIKIVFNISQNLQF